MIPLQLTTALAVYSSLIAMGALIIWLHTETANQRYRHGLGKQHLWKCVFCGYTYLDEHAERMSTCPRCESINLLDNRQPAAALRPPAHNTPQRETKPNPDDKRRNPSKRKQPNQRKRGPRRHRR